MRVCVIGRDSRCAKFMSAPADLCIWIYYSFCGAFITATKDLFSVSLRNVFRLLLESHFFYVNQKFQKVALLIENELIKYEGNSYKHIRICLFQCFINEVIFRAEYMKQTSKLPTP